MSFSNCLGTIIYFGGMELPSSNAAAHRVLNNAKAFRQIGYRVVFCGVDRRIKQNTVIPFCVEGFDSYPMKYPSNSKEWIWQLISFSHFKFVLSKYDDIKFVISYNLHSSHLKKILKYCKKNNINSIVDITEWYENRFSLNPIKFIKWIDTNNVMKRLHKKADGIISISSYLTNYYHKSVKHISQIPPLVDVSDDIWNQTPYLKKDNVVQFVYSGVPGKDKDKICDIISAFLKLPTNYNYTFIILGLTRKEFISSYPNMSNALLHLGEKICFKGRVEHSESALHMLSCDYCIFIRDRSRKNMAGFPTKFAECVTSGIGVIANDISNINDYFPLNNSQILKSFDIDSIANSLKHAIDNGKVIHSKSKIFDYRNYIEKLEQFLLRIKNND